MVVFQGLNISGMEGVACFRHWLGIPYFCFGCLVVMKDGSAL